MSGRVRARYGICLRGRGFLCTVAAGWDRVDPDVVASGDSDSGNALMLQVREPSDFPSHGSIALQAGFIDRCLPAFV